MQNLYTNPDPILNCPNKWDGRNGHEVKAVVIHKPEGELPGVIDYLMKPETQKSYHYIISYQGQITRLVDDSNSAWHAGVVEAPTWPGLIPDVNPNYYTVGIALEGFAVQPHTKAQFQALMRLIADLFLSYGIAANNETIVFHHEINAPKSCPGLQLNKFAIVNAVQSLVSAGNLVGWTEERA